MLNYLGNEATVNISKKYKHRNCENTRWYTIYISFLVLRNLCVCITSNAMLNLCVLNSFTAKRLKVRNHVVHLQLYRIDVNVKAIYAAEADCCSFRYYKGLASSEVVLSRECVRATSDFCYFVDVGQLTLNFSRNFTLAFIRLLISQHTLRII